MDVPAPKVEGNKERYDGIEMTDKTKAAKVLIATPNYTNLFSAETHVSHMECTTAWTKWGINFSWSVVGRTFVHFARTMLCKASLDAQFTHILWLDDDAIIEAELLPRYLEHDKDVMITPYFMRRPPHEIGILLSTINDFHDHSSYRNLVLSDLDQGLIEVDGGGTHAMLIKTEVFDRKGENSTYHTPYPPQLIKVINSLSADDKDIIDHYVGELPDESMSMTEENELGKPYFMMPKVGTEDMLWCYRAKKKGIEIWCDTDVDAGHVGFAPIITRRHREAAEQEQLESLEAEHSGIPDIEIDKSDRRPEGQDLEAEVSVVRDAPANLRRHTIDARKAANLI